MTQTTSNILMVRPANFGFNEETAGNNAFQVNDQSISAETIQDRAVSEFDKMVATLRAAGINVIVAEDSPQPIKRDAVFPNNWVTFHSDGTVMTYPMYSPNRRQERREDILNQIGTDFDIRQIYRLEGAEAENRFLEGTGSMIFDRVNKIVYACLSPRTDDFLLEEFCQKTGSQKMRFTAVDQYGQDIYHTNVMMALAETFVVICLETIRDENERAELLSHFARTNKEVVEISLAQMMAFAGNMLQVRNTQGALFLVMSEQAYRSLNTSQITTIQQHCNILYSPIDTIETYGGGSARCMMAEVFLPAKND